MAKKASKTSSTIASNRRALFDYTILDEFVAGIVLLGFEAKSARLGNVSLKGAFVTLKNGEAWLTNATIGRYKHATTIEQYDDVRPRKLLLSRAELKQLQAAKDAGYTIVPLNMFLAHGFIKIRIATARGKKRYDKRQTIKRRQTDRETKRQMSRKNQKL